MKRLALTLLLLFCAGLLGCPGQIVEYPEKGELTKNELKAALTGDDFRKKNAAREQIETLTPAERVELLSDLLKEGDAPTRMLAISELMKLPEASYKPLLEGVAASDPDPEVREMAGMALGLESDDDSDEESSADEEGGE
jgi:HEAT repeat protein